MPVPGPELLTFPCAGCGAGMCFDPPTQGLACPQCGSRTPLSLPPAIALEYDLEATLAKGKGRASEPDARAISCPGCAARIRLTGGLEARPCPFCGAGLVIEDLPDDPILPPESVLTFRVDRASARGLFRTWLAGRWFAPSDLKRRGETERLKGVYVPFWTYDARADSEWTALSGTYYYTTESYRDSQGRTRTRQVRHVRWWPSSGTHAGAYDDVPVCASKGLPDGMLEAIEPFDLKALVSYDPRLLAGWEAEGYAVDLREGWKTAAVRIRVAEERACDAQVPGDTHMNLNVRTTLGGMTFKLILLPVWVAAYRYREKTYRFLINGQTGEVRGDSPWSPWKVAGAVLVGLGTLLVIAWALGR